MPPSVTVTEPSRLFPVEVPSLIAFVARKLPDRCALAGRCACPVSKTLIRADAAVSQRQVARAPPWASDTSRD